MKSKVEQKPSREEEMRLVEAILKESSDVTEEHLEQLLRCCEKQIRYFAKKFELEEDDLLQRLAIHIFEDNWRRLRTFKGESSLSTWFGKVVYRLCVNIVRDQKREKKRRKPMPDTENLESQSNGRHSDPELDPIVNGLTASELHSALHKLSGDDRALLIADCWDDLSGDEIAELFGLSLGNARVKLTRARQRLRMILEDIQND